MSDATPTSTLANPPKMSPIPFLDWVRGLAILMVYACHSLDYAFDLDTLRWQGLWSNWNIPWLVKALYPLQFGHLGVAVFFVVSGLCIQLSWQKSSAGGWGNFFQRRFFRIYPPYFVALIVFGVSPLFSPWPVNWPEWVSHALLLHNFKPDWAWGINSSFWSVAVECQLYMVFPLLVWMRAKGQWAKILPCLVLLEGLLRLWQGLGDCGLYPKPWFVLTMSPLGYWGSWAMGAWLADAWLDRRVTVFNKPVFGRWLLLFCTLATIGCLLTRLTYPMAFLLAALTTTGWLARQLGKLPHKQIKLPGYLGLSQIGLVSYSIYLWHQPLILKGLPWLAQAVGGHTMNFMLSVPGKLFCCVLLWPMVLFISAVSYQWLEKTSMLLGRLVQKDKNSSKPSIFWISLNKNAIKPNIKAGS